MFFCPIVLIKHPYSDLSLSWTRWVFSDCKTRSPHWKMLLEVKLVHCWVVSLKLWHRLLPECSYLAAITFPYHAEV